MVANTRPSILSVIGIGYFISLISADRAVYEYARGISSPSGQPWAISVTAFLQATVVFIILWLPERGRYFFSNKYNPNWAKALLGGRQQSAFSGQLWLNIERYTSLWCKRYKISFWIFLLIADRWQLTAVNWAFSLNWGTNQDFSETKTMGSFFAHHFFCQEWRPAPVFFSQFFGEQGGDSMQTDHIKRFISMFL